MGYGPLTSSLNLIGAGLFLLHVLALVDVIVRPAAVFPAVEKQTKQLWLILLCVAVAWDALPMLQLHSLIFRGPLDLIVLAGTVVALVYLLDARPAVRAAGGRGPRRRPPQGPRGGW
ncbi:MAG TPA: DUF2516 family protein [Sporichthyaceae bacterium]|jgi:hypothetical protein|nr:DUF2516 family protein [Sporichthyaceae bacterium]